MNIICHIILQNSCVMVYLFVEYQMINVNKTDVFRFSRISYGGFLFFGYPKNHLVFNLQLSLVLSIDTDNSIPLPSYSNIPNSHKFESKISLQKYIRMVQYNVRWFVMYCCGLIYEKCHCC